MKLLPQFLTDFNNVQEKCQVAGSPQVVAKKILIEGEIGGKGGKFALAAVFNGF